MTKTTETSLTPAGEAGTFPLGGLTVRRLGYGAMQLPGPGVIGPPRDHDEAVRVLRRAVELGVDHIDTAQFYGPDVANALIREALHPYADDLALVSKVGARRDASGRWTVAQRPDQLREDVEANLRSLGTDRVAAVNLRRMDTHPDTRPADVVPLEAQLAEMVALRDEGKVGGVGVSTVTLAQVDTAIEQAGIVCVQNAYSLLDQSDTPVLERCAEAGVAYVPYFPLGSAFAHIASVTDHPPVVALAAERGVTPAQVGLAWLLARSPNVLLIPGTSSVAHLEQNVAAADLRLSDDDVARLELPSPDRPD
ncbi:MAG TPA: oxidoreductase [Lapillicoccus sp.]|uniref:oxidoreductase n=1 Tax=Lapillicoccus sp. TaxID=1909287 RepID=UPI002F956B60